MHIDLVKKTTKAQINFFGELSINQENILNEAILLAYKKTSICINSYLTIPNDFNIFQTHHNIVFLYHLSNTLFLINTPEAIQLAEKTYLLNRMLNSIDLFYKIKMPTYFLIGHGLGCVFSNAEYGNYLVVFQNVTIGFQDGFYPKIKDKVIIYPNSIISGNTTIGENSIIGAGTKLINKSIPENSIVYENGSRLVIKPNDRNEIHKYFDVLE